MVRKGKSFHRSTIAPGASHAGSKSLIESGRKHLGSLGSTDLPIIFLLGLVNSMARWSQSFKPRIPQLETGWSAWSNPCVDKTTDLRPVGVTEFLAGRGRTMTGDHGIDRVGFLPGRARFSAKSRDSSMRSGAIPGAVWLLQAKLSWRDRDPRTVCKGHRQDATEENR